MVLVVTAAALVLWALAPDTAVTSWAMLFAGPAVVVRLACWRGAHTWREPLLVILHIGYGWLALGLLLAGIDGIYEFLPATAALHALTVGAIGTMTLAVMTRASLGHTGRPLSAGPGTAAIYLLITAAAILRILSPLAGGETVLLLWLAGAAWSGAFGLFTLLYGNALARPQPAAGLGRPI